MGNQDATMLDVREKERPPGDPPDGSKTWAQKVVGSSGCGLLKPEDVLDEAFVLERMTLEFPDGEDGESEEEYMAALTGGPWRVFGSYLLVQAWSPEFNPLKDEIATTPVWIRVADMPYNLYHNTILMEITKGLGNPIKVDLTTLHFDRARFARVCVEVDLKKPLKGSIQVNGERYFVSYEGLSNICAICGLYGHSVSACPRRVAEVVMDSSPKNGQVKHVPRENGLSPEGSQHEDGFTPVRRGGGGRRSRRVVWKRR